MHVNVLSAHALSGQTLAGTNSVAPALPRISNQIAERNAARLRDAATVIASALVVLLASALAVAMGLS